MSQLISNNTGISFRVIALLKYIKIKKHEK